ncbi:glucan endo-1,3-beta-glucosidase 8-like [Diospyros lotus]|uniref:glucan endo-1,3-beta-glucosidase 8-like n=1 Tax=Diospyros lotus TaxID=55363 RepID=UPI0022512DD6|nr:glucan endo-1,3-beta-glucosidase 8-like [Diospyros lotus]
MARAMVTCWVAVLGMAMAMAGVANGFVGVNWGDFCSQNMPVHIVVQMLKDNGVEHVKIFDSNAATIKGFAGTGIELMIGIPNVELQEISDNYEKAREWVRENITQYIKDGEINIRYVAVGNEPFLKSYSGLFLNVTLRALQNIQSALDEIGHGETVKATVAHNADVYQSADEMPSEGDFRADIRDVMVEMVRWMKENNSPFVVNIYPFLAVYQDPDFPMEYAFFDGKSDPVRDHNITYTNMFDANFDTLVNALSKAGAPDLDIIVGEIGWPTDGNINANTKLAQRFYAGLIKKLGSEKGTPLRPGRRISAYLFSLLDENMKSIAPGNFERHWGIFRYDGQPKFPVDLSGEGREGVWPVAAKGVQYGAPMYCLLNLEGNPNMSLVQPNIDYACAAADCTALTYGSSCSNMDLVGNASYAFNMYYHMYDQNGEACIFNGLGTLSMSNLSTDSCLFPIRIIAENAGQPRFASSVLGSLASLLLVLLGFVSGLGL